MKGGKGNNRRGPKWSPLMTGVQPDSSNFSQDIHHGGGGHSFLSRANAPPAPPLSNIGWGDVHSPRWRGGPNSPLHQQGAAGVQHQQWGSPVPSPPGTMSPRGHHPHQHQRGRGFRSPPNVQGGHNASSQIPPGVHLNGGAVWRPTIPIQNLSGFPLNEMMMSSPEGLSFPQASWGSEGTVRVPLGHFDIVGLPPGEDKLSYLDRLATRALNDILAAKTGVSTVKVALATLSAIGAPAFEVAGVLPHEIPCLRKLTALEGRVNAYIHAYVAGRKIATLYDLSIDLPREEGVKEFEDLGLGPILCHELVVHYFSPPAGVLLHQITTVEVIEQLACWVAKHPKEKLQVESFLSFLASRHSVPSPEHLFVRVQSLGTHVGHIRRSKKAEVDKINIWEGRARAEMARSEKQNVMKRVSLFLAAEREKEAPSGKRKRFCSETSRDTDDDAGDEDSVDDTPQKIPQSSASRQKSKADIESRMAVPMSATSCPYPSAAEERSRVKKLELQHFAANSEKDDFYLSRPELLEFLAVMKDACQNHSVHEVLMKLIGTSRRYKGTKKRSGKSKTFKAYPAIGLLNVAVLSVKAGFWDSMYQNFLNAADETGGSRKEKIRSVQIVAPIDVPSSKQNTDCQVSNLPGPQEIVAVVSEHYEKHLRPQIVDLRQSQQKAWWSFLRWVSECESWITGKYSVASFASLGFGSFSHFLEQYIELLPSWIIPTIGEKAKSRRPEAKVPKERLFSFLEQALRTVRENGPFVKDYVLGLLHRQFKVSSIDELGFSSFESLLETSKDATSMLAPIDHVFYSELLAVSDVTKGISALDQSKDDSPQSEESDTTPETQVGVLGCKSSDDAAKCLLKAPYLADLAQWSQWHSVFAPTLGPLLDWVEREGTKCGLHAMVTCDGALLRIDGKATADGFLLATVKGLGEEMAAVLMSLIALYGGIANAPTALLKSHASKGLDILLGSSAGEWTSQSPASRPVVHTKRKFSEQLGGEVVNQAYLFRDVKPKSAVGLTASGKSRDNADGDFHESVAGRIRNQSVVASQCVMECLSFVIPEFRTFTADILLPALSPLIAGAPALLMSTCSTSQQKSILHGLGFCLGIPEWISDYNSRAFGQTQSSSSDTCGPENMEVDKYDQGKLGTEVSDKLVICNGSSPIGNTLKLESENGCEDVEIPTINISSTSKAEKSQRSPQRTVSNGSIRKGHTKGKRSKAVTSEDMSPETASLEVEAETVSLEVEAAKIIEEIRQHEFGVGQNIKGKGYDLLARQHARMGRALHRLSSDLYSQDSHFVLELVQNADDNSYNPGVEAALLFLIQEGRIVVLNNEIGFEAPNIRALCDVGNSTKAGKNTGYIGHKGIGFKSVFRVTDAPEIHSNGFHVKFDISEGDLGFILPTSIPPPVVGDSISDITALLSESAMPRNVTGCWNTRINLPIKASLQKGTGLNLLASKFSDLHPSLLLFLNRLRRVVIRNNLNGSTVVMHREDKGEDLVEVGHGTGTTTWMVVRQQLKAAVHRPGVTDTEIALAFQLNDVSIGNYEACFDQQQVFAFLPLRSYGLRFILQGDFKVPSSREEVDCDSDWNQWLRSEIPNVFLKSAKTFQRTLGGGSPGRAVSSFMSFVPMEGEVVGFFSPLPRTILSNLRGSACLPVEGGGWAIPCVLLRGWTDSARQLLPDVFLNEHLGLRYLDKDVMITDLLALKLGVQQFGAGTLVAVMKSVCQKHGALISLGIEWIQAWLLALHDCLLSDQKIHHPIIYEEKYSSFRLELQSLPYIPLSSGMFTSILDGSVWFAGDLLDNRLGMNSVLSEFKLLASELRTVHPDLVSLKGECVFSEESAGASSRLLNVGLLEKNPIEKVVSILQRLGVSKLSAHELLKSHVLPAMAKDDCLCKDQNLAVEYLGFVIKHLQSNCVSCTTGEFNVRAELKKCAVIMTSNGLVRAGQKPIHFSPAMGNNISNISLILEGTSIPWVEVSPLYLQLQGKGCELAHLRNFFKDLGVTDFVKVVHTERKLLNKSASEWKNCLWEGGEVAELVWIVQDWHSPELARLLMHMSTDGNAGPMERQQNCSSRLRERSASILAALDQSWDDYYCKFSEASYSPLAVNDRALQKATVSSFLLLLRQCTWVSSHLDRKLYAPTDLFKHCEAVESILGSHAPYVDTPIQSTAFMDALGLRTQVSVDDALGVLRYWSEEKGFFEASVEQLTRLYTFLSTKLPSCKENVVQMFRSGKYIFVPLHRNHNDQVVQKGRFYSVENVCWSDPTKTLDLLSLDQKTRLRVPVASLCGIYPSLHGFFVRVCLVQETPSFDGYLEIIKKVAAEQPPSAKLSHVMDVCNLWSSEISRSNVEPSEILRWNGRLKEAESRIFATNQDKWVSLNDHKGLVCICDDKRLGEEFEEFLGYIHFILMTDDDLREITKQSGSQKPAKWDLQPLVQALGILNLSEVVERQVIKYGPHDGSKIAALVDWILPYAQRYLKHHHVDQYRYLQGHGITETLRRLQFIAVYRLYFQYSIRKIGIQSKRKTPCTCILEASTLYVVEDLVQDYCSIYAELSRLFFSGKPNLPIANFLHLITLMASSGSSKIEVEGFVQKMQGIQPVIEGEDLWTLGTTVKTGHQGTHLVGVPPKPWEVSVNGENITELPGQSSGLNMLECNRSQVTSFHAHDIAENSNSKEDTFWGASSRSMVENRAFGGLSNMDVKNVASVRRPSYPLSIQGNGDVHAGKASGCQEVQYVSPSQALQGARSITEAQIRTMDVHEATIAGSDSLFENTPQSRALANFQGRDSLGIQPTNEQQRETGRSGEAVVYQHLVKHYGAAHVNWLNQDAESGAAYDIVVTKDSGKKEFVEVKATRSAGKDWFEISPYEWDFARSHPESFTIIRVCLGSTSQQVRLLRLPNPVKLAQDHVLQLALLLPALQDREYNNL